MSIKERNELRNLIDEYKNTRSWLDVIQFQLFPTADVKAFSAVTVNEQIIIDSR